MHTIIIKVWRGLISEVYSDDPDTEVVVIDEDVESTEAPEIELPEHRAVSYTHLSSYVVAQL